MERLTENVLGNIQLKACGNDFCKETCAEHDEEKSCDNCPIQKAFEKLADYEDLEEQGKLLKLPCAVGDTVWFIKSNFSYMQNPKAERVRKIKIIKEEIIFRTENRRFEMKYIGKIVFLTKSAAEQALKEMEGKK